MKLLTYFHTLKYLKSSQIYFRIRRRFIHPKPHYVVGRQSKKNGEWVGHALYEQKLFDKSHVRFLNQDGVIKFSSDWNNDSHEKLWLYNLHYFDDLAGIGSDSRAELQLDFIQEWIKNNPAPSGNGWEPYPTSLRIVNWVKAFLSGLPTDDLILNSLAQQSDFLSQDLERHLLGNHLFVNSKALIFSGVYFEGKEAEGWLALGFEIYNKELDEQVLADGGNFELTPMYHLIMLVDLLDLINLFNAFPDKVDEANVLKTKAVAIRMLEWLKIMSHNDGEISFFNDSCFGIAPETTRVFEYAKRLGLENLKQRDIYPDTIELHDLQNSGYVSVKSQEYSLIADLSPIGPDYIPGHAHADTLSFEFSLGSQRVFVNSGISEYGISEERLRQRKTPSHNTVSVNSLDSSQVWSGFRVAKRARVSQRIVGKVFKNKVTFGAAHDGFKKQGVNCVHSRTWQASEGVISLVDKLNGNFEMAIGYFHLHPDVELISVNNSEVKLQTDEYILALDISGAEISVIDTTWHPQFGMSIDNKKLELKFLTDSISVEITWCKK